MKTTRDVIKITPTSKSFGYLSNESKYSINVHGKRYPTVEHFLLSKKFEGTQLEEAIRTANTIYQARKLGSTSDTVIYDKTTYHVREDWDDVYPLLLKEGVVSKFEQNPFLKKKLLETYDSKIIDQKNKELGDVIESYRDSLQNITPQKREFVLQTDETLHSLSPTEKELVNDILTLSQKLVNVEGLEKVTCENIEDAMNIFLENQNLFSEVKNFTKSVQKIPLSTFEEKFSGVSAIAKIVKSTLSDYGSSHQNEVGSSKDIASFIVWYRHLPKKNIDYINNRMKNFDSIEIRIPKVKRMYRSSAPRRKTGTITQHTKESEKRILSELFSGKPLKSVITITKKDFKKILEDYFPNEKILLSNDELGEFFENYKKQTISNEKRLIREHMFEIGLENVNDLTLREMKKIIIDFFGDSTLLSNSELKKYISDIYNSMSSGLEPTTTKGLKIAKDGDVYYVYGKSLEEYIPQLIDAGGYYKKEEHTNRILANDYMIFTGEALKKHRDILLKPVKDGGYGGEYKREARSINKNVVIIRNSNVLNDSRGILEDMGGQYEFIEKREYTNTFGRIYFNPQNKRKIDRIVSSSKKKKLSGDVRIERWLKEKIVDLFDCGAILTGGGVNANITENELKIILEEIFSCNFKKMEHYPEYSSIAEDIIEKASNDSRVSYITLSDGGKKYATDYATRLFGTMKYLTEGRDFDTVMREINNMTSHHKECSKFESLSPIDVCAIKSVVVVSRHTTEKDKIKNAILISLPQLNRTAFREYFDYTYEQVSDKLKYVDNSPIFRLLKHMNVTGTSPDDIVKYGIFISFIRKIKVEDNLHVRRFNAIIENKI